jgi:hypothetical protein
MWIGWCPACGSDDFWIYRKGEDDWTHSCPNGCSRAQVENGSERLVVAQRARMDFEREATATMEPDDPLYGIPVEAVIERLTGQQARHGFFTCPFHGDGNERTPSLHATGPFWHCQACKLGGSAYDFGAHWWKIEPRKDGFLELRERLVNVLLAGRA